MSDVTHFSGVRVKDGTGEDGRQEATATVQVGAEVLH